MAVGLEKEFRKKFLEEMSVVAEAVYKAFQPDKLNYERYLPTDEEVDALKRMLSEELDKLLQ